MRARPAPVFIADDPALDFLNTRATPTRGEVEWIEDGRDLVDWLRRIGAMPPEAEALAATAVAGELDHAAARARALREWFRGFVLAHAGRALDRADLAQLDELNRLLARDEMHGSVGADDAGGLAWRWHRRWATPESLLQPIARAMATLVCEVDFTDVRRCEGHACTLLFRDVTKARARRWCSMGVCGNRAKQAAHRDRARGALSG